jgi:PAS domain S-box-containing protein
MTQHAVTRQIDYQAAFKHAPGSATLMDSDFVILDVNDNLLELNGRELGDLVGRNFFEVFPANPRARDNAGRERLREAMDEAVRTGDRVVRRLDRYDVEDSGRPGVFEERYWSGVVTPIQDSSGQVAMIALWGHEVSGIITQLRAQEADLG